VKAAAIEPDQPAKVDVGADIDLMGIGRALRQPARRVGGEFGNVVPAQGDALRDEIGARAAPVARQALAPRVVQPRLGVAT
jgi:hypothetical protein